jgi:mono/diheme cytochrome c family protein
MSVTNGVARVGLAACLLGLGFAGLGVVSPHFGGVARAADAPPPYVVKNGNEVDMSTYKGYLYYGDQCLRCHGPDGAGSSYAPNLTLSLKSLSKEQFENTVINGKREVNQASDRVMPSFGTNEDVVDNLDNIYGYLKARSDGVLDRGHPHHLPQP